MRPETKKKLQLVDALIAEGASMRSAVKKAELSAPTYRKYKKRAQPQPFISTTIINGSSPKILVMLCTIDQARELFK